jgi:putative endonuclease
MNGKLYTGITTNIANRFKKHLTGKGSKFLKSNPPKKIVYVEKHINKSEASKREYQIKNMSKKDKLYIINLFNPNSKDLK